MGMDEGKVFEQSGQAVGVGHDIRGEAGDIFAQLMVDVEFTFGTRFQVRRPKRQGIFQDILLVVGHRYLAFA